MLEIGDRSRSARLAASGRDAPYRCQRTLVRPIAFSGIGLHSGLTVSGTLRPAAPDQGIVFERTDLQPTACLAARWCHVVDTHLSTVLTGEDGTRIATVEHLMAAFAGAGVDNALVEIDGPELPALDGSAAPFLDLIEAAGCIEQPAVRSAIQVLKTVSVGDGARRARLSPSDDFSLNVSIDFPGTLIGAQAYRFHMSEAAFGAEIAPARTFGFLHEVNAMRASGRGLGGSLDNAVVIGDEAILNEKGLRFPDEFVRHKVLDAIGDLYLAGAPLLGHFEGSQSGHRLNNMLLRDLFAERGAWRFVPLPAGKAAAEPAAATA